MPESGGPTTQSGTYFQNTVAAWYMARMLSDTLQGQTDNRIIRIRCEAPEDIDDIIITFERGIHYVQVKEALSAGEKAWAGLWVHSWKQFARIDPSHDRLVLWGGQYTQLFRNLQEMVKRAKSTPSGSRRKQFQEFLNRLNKSQLSLLDSITNIIRDYENKTAPEQKLTEITQLDIFELLRTVEVVVKGTADEIQEQTINTHLNGLDNLSTAFTVLRDLAAEKARSRGTWDPDRLLQALTAQGFEFDTQELHPSFQTAQDALERELTMRKNNWYLLRQQAAIFGAAMVPLHLQNQMDQEENIIRDIEHKLAQFK